MSSMTCSTNFPNNVLIDLKESMGRVLESTPPGVNIDFVDLAYTACVIHANAEEFYSVTDEVADMIECNYASALDAIIGTNSEGVAAVARQEFQVALECFVQDVKAKLELHHFPRLIESGIAYMPGSFIPNTTTLVLQQQEELSECCQ